MVISKILFRVLGPQCHVISHDISICGQQLYLLWHTCMSFTHNLNFKKPMSITKIENIRLIQSSNLK